jgi:predicted regulator of Ras-like GTPase activity (Roadblock/LC7/MglB family)
MSAALKPIAPQNITSQNIETNTVGMQRRMECQNALTHLLEREPAILFASAATADGRSYAHANAATCEADAQRSAAVMSSLLGLIESFSKEALNSRALYSCIATEHGSIVIARIPSKAKAHALCVCADTTENLATIVRAALDTAALLAEKLDP